MNKRTPQKHQKSTKHFLDTSVLRPVLLGTHAYRKYFEQQFNDERQYISDYVLMEFRRSYLRNILNFYFMLDMPSIETIGDALKGWSHKFKTSELKAVQQFVGDISDIFRLNRANPKDKSKALREIGRYVNRLEMKSRHTFKNIGRNETDCQRAKIPLSSWKESNMTEMFRLFLQEFNNGTSCRSQCTVGSFFLKRYREQVEAFLKYADTLSNPGKSENKGFMNIVRQLKEAQDEDDFSCRLCEAIGDAVIALEAPRDMRLEHTDHSFDHLCPLLKQPHHKHPSEISVLKNGVDWEGNLKEAR
jgi:hypothetical protein